METNKLFSNAATNEMQIVDHWNDTKRSTIVVGILNTSPTLPTPEYNNPYDDGMDVRACFDSIVDDELANSIRLYDKLNPEGITVLCKDMQETEFTEKDGTKVRKRFINLTPGARVRIPTGIFVNLPINTRLQVYPRSGWSINYGLTVVNTPGKVDGGYHKCINVILINHGFETVVIPHGERIAQFSIEESFMGSFNRYNDMDEYMSSIKGKIDRGGGFGHSGTK